MEVNKDKPSAIAQLISEHFTRTAEHAEAVDKLIRENGVVTCIYCGELTLQGLTLNQEGFWEATAKQAMADHMMACPKRPEKKLLDIIDSQNEALSFCRDLAEEELGFQRVGTGAEVALRHIARKARETIAAQLNSLNGNDQS
jgi:hypothetical protein